MLSASLLLSFILIMSLLFLFLSLVLALSSGAPLSLLLTQRSCQCLLLLIQVSNPPPVKTGRGTGRAIRCLYRSSAICYRSSACVPPCWPPPPWRLADVLIAASPGPQTHTCAQTIPPPLDHAFGLEASSDWFLPQVSTSIVFCRPAFPHAVNTELPRITKTHSVKGLFSHNLL